MCREEILGFCKVITKGLFRKCEYMSIYCRWVKVVFAVKIHTAFLCPTTPHRWTAIGMGADRDHPAIGTLSIAIDPLTP